MIWFLSIQRWKWSQYNMEDGRRFILKMSEAYSPNSRNARGLRWNHLKQRRNCGANWTSFHCSAAWAVRTVHWLAHCPVRGTLEQRISYIDCNLCDEMLRNCCSSHRSSPTTTSSEPSFSVPNTAFPLLQLAAIRPSTLQHCSTALQARCQDTVTRRHGPTLNSAICIDIRMARGGARTRRRGERCILHSPWPGARQLVVCPAVRCFLVLIGKIILLTSLGMITRKQELPSLWDRNYVSQFIWFFNCIAMPNPNARPNSKI